MRPQNSLRARWPLAAWLGALFTLAIAMGAGVAPASSASPQTIDVSDSRLRYGQPVVVRGTVGAEHAGRSLALEHGSDRMGWRTIATTTAARDGAYAFRVGLRRSGEVRVAVGEPARAADGGATAPRAAGATAAASGPRTAPLRVTVKAGLPVPYRRLEVLAGRTAVVRGVVRPARAGRTVRLERRAGRRWVTIARDRTDPRGRYELSHRTRGTGSGQVRVRFAGDDANAAVARAIGRLSAYRPALASRYDLYGGPLGCGGRLGYDSLVVAHKTLPCGTRVRVRYRGRSVAAVVRDRGPYVGGREFDLAGAVARRLGFDGVGVVWVTR